MPQYQYRCQTNHLHTLNHPIDECNVNHHCPDCGTLMHRIPQEIRVNWNGLPPHMEGTRPPVIQDFIDSAPERRARYLDNKE